MIVNISLLKFGAALLIGFGVLFVLSTWPPLAAPLTLLVDLFAWPLDGGQTLAAEATRLALAIGGGVLAGWGAMIWLVATRLADRDPELARSLVLGPVVVWFVLDCLGSVVAGVPLNVVLNIGFLAVFFAAFRGVAKPRQA